MTFTPPQQQKFSEILISANSATFCINVVRVNVIGDNIILSQVQYCTLKWRDFWKKFGHSHVVVCRLFWNPKYNIYFDLLLFHLGQGLTSLRKSLISNIPKRALHTVKSAKFIYLFIISKLFT